MALINANGIAVLSAVISIPRTGVWHVDLAVDTPDDITGAVTIQIDDGRLALNGTVSRGGNFVDTAHVRVLAGAAGLATVATPKHYTSTSVQDVLGDLLSNAGERLSATADADTLARSLGAWTTVAAPVGSLIARLLAAAAPGANWRMLPDGTLWVGPETWPDSGLVEDSDYQVLNEKPTQAEVVLGSEAPLLLSGVVLGDRRVSFVEHRAGLDAIRSRVWFEADGAAGDRMADAWRGAVGGATPDATYRMLFLANVVRQAGGTVDVDSADDRTPSMAGVPLFLGEPGASADGSVGGQVLVGWSGGDPSRPFAIGCNAVNGSTVVLAADALFLGGQAGSQRTILGETYRQAEAQMHSVQTDTATAVASTLTTALAGELMPPSGAFVSLYPQTTALLLAIGADVAARLAAQVGFEAGSPTYLTTNASVK